MSTERAKDSEGLRELEDLLVKFISRDPFGCTGSGITKALPPAYRKMKRHIPAVLNDLSARGKIHSWQPPAGKSKTQPAPIYSARPLAERVGQHISRLLTAKAMTPAELKKEFPAPIKAHLMLFLEFLIQSRIVKRHPPVKGKKLSLKDPDPAEYLAPEIRRLFEKGKRLGFSEAAIAGALAKQSEIRVQVCVAAPTAPQVEALVFKAMIALKPAASQGALVYIPDLRAALRDAFVDKESFDRAILELAREERVQLQSHSLPDTLSEEQKRAMIDNRRGSFFMAVGIRME